jgi:hypothetical protein
MNKPMNEQKRRALDEVRKAAEFYEETWCDWYDGGCALPKSLAFDHAALERVASYLEAAGEGETARLLRALRPVLADTTHEVFRGATPEERENMLLPASAN